MPYKEYRNPRNQLHRAGGPAVESDDRKEWWVEGRRHREDGPAVETVHGTIWYFWRGVRVPEHVILDPRSRQPKEILKEVNAEVRRAWMEAYGLDDFILDLKPVVLHENKQKEMTLLKVEIPNDEALVMVRVKNSTPEPDGHYKFYMLRVPPTMKTAEEAVAWTFDMSEKQYAPVVET